MIRKDKIEDLIHNPIDYNTAIEAILENDSSSYQKLCSYRLR